MMLRSVLKAISEEALTFKAIADKLNCSLSEVETAVGMLIALGYLDVCQGVCEEYPYEELCEWHLRDH